MIFSESDELGQIYNVNAQEHSRTLLLYTEIFLFIIVELLTELL